MSWKDVCNLFLFAFFVGVGGNAVIDHVNKYHYMQTRAYEIERDIRRATDKTGNGILWRAEDVRFVARVLELQEQRYGVPARLILGVWIHESALIPHAVNYNQNGSADFGLGQINSGTYRWLLVRALDDVPEYRDLLTKASLYDVRKNAVLSSVYLGVLYKTYNGQVDQILTAYNSGVARPLWGRYARYVSAVKRKYRKVLGRL